MAEREIPKVKHVFRKTFGIIAGIFSVLSLGGAVGVGLTSGVLFTAFEFAVAGLSVGLLTAAAVGAIATVSTIAIHRNKVIAAKTQKQLDNYRKDKTSSNSEEARKALLKNTGANKYLIKHNGGTPFGILKSVVGNQKVANIVNYITYLEQERDVARSAGNLKKVQKYDKAIEKLYKKMEKETRDIRTGGRVGTVYAEVAGTTTYFRDKEIKSLSDGAREEFFKLVEPIDSAKSKEKTIITVNFSKDSKVIPTHAVVPSPTMTKSAADILLKDVVTKCEEYDEDLINRMFPIVIEAKVINSFSTEVTGKDALTFNNLKELKKYLSSDQEKDIEK